MLIYLAHPIDQAAHRRMGHVLVRIVANILETGRQQGHSFYRPGGAFNLPIPPWDGPDVRAVDQINQNAQFECSGLIAVVIPGIPTLGTIAEIEQSLLLNRPTCIITTEGLRASSVQMGNWASRGAQIILMSESGDLYNLNIAEALGSLPDPTQLFSPALLINEDPSMQVRHTEAAKTQLARGKYEGDAGIDLSLAHDLLLQPGDYALAPTGVHVAIPEGYFGLIIGRSSTWAKHQCDVRQAVIDSGYRGELMIGIQNQGFNAAGFEAGVRLAQLVLLPVWGGKIEPVEVLPDHERGEAGYGSSGQ